MIDIRQIMNMLPHRYPFLLVDRVLEMEAGSHIRAYKNVSINESFFQGHFPGLPVMPGVLTLEALAQAGGLLVVQSLNLSAEKNVFLFTGMNNVKFRRPVVPGDRLDLYVSDTKNKLNIWKMHGVATVDGEVAAEGDFSAAVVGREKI